MRANSARIFAACSSEQPLAMRVTGPRWPAASDAYQLLMACQCW